MRFSGPEELPMVPGDERAVVQAFGLTLLAGWQVLITFAGVSAFFPLDIEPH
jgi:hypothetical protein